MKDFSFVTSSHPGYIENLYKEFVKNPETIDTDLRKFFEGFDFAVNNGNGKTNGAAVSTAAAPAPQLDKEFSVYKLIIAYRNKGHLVAKTNPIRERKDRHANLDLKYFDLNDNDLNTEFYSGKFAGLGKAKLSVIIDHLKKCYTGSLGTEFSYVNDKEKFDWMINAVENTMLQPLSINQKKRILQKLNEGVMFEKFLHTKYIGQKRFSLEGGETTIAALDAIINVASENNTEEVVIGMAHRGRLNILANIIGKTYEQIFTEFEGNSVPDTTMGSGDVKYHMGYSSEVETMSGKKIHLKLAPNPSHLEAVDPVVIGFARAKQMLYMKAIMIKFFPYLFMVMRQWQARE